MTETDLQTAIKLGMLNFLSLTNDNSSSINVKIHKELLKDLNDNTNGTQSLINNGGGNENKIMIDQLLFIGLLVIAGLLLIFCICAIFCLIVYANKTNSFVSLVITSVVLCFVCLLN